MADELNYYADNLDETIEKLKVAPNVPNPFVDDELRRKFLVAHFELTRNGMRLEARVKELEARN